MTFGHHPAISREDLQSLPDRVERFDAGQMNINGIVMLMQDLLYMNGLDKLPRKFQVAAQHCVDHGYCTVYGRMLQ